MFHSPDAVTFAARASPTVKFNIVVKFEAVEFGETVVPSNLCHNIARFTKFSIDFVLCCHYTLMISSSRVTYDCPSSGIYPDNRGTLFTASGPNLA